ncbi:MAG: 16S rRNA (cytosine(967)-C(5))-methyltransferase RsmB [Eubacteriaceae bacterium]|nr:16S rRNA (cytosine(967)-C(5))-methyltransferase RsmB [Eubacteriaceae bacterium]
MDINRITAYNVLFDIEKNGAYSNIELNKQISLLSPDSPAFVRELVYGVTENRLYIDYILSQLIAKGLRGVKKQPLTLLRMGIYQLRFMDSVPEYAAVNETVNLARKLARGREGFINGVLRGYIKRKNEDFLPDRETDSVHYLSVKYSYAEWIVKLWIEQYGEEACEAMLAAGNQTPKLSIRVNTMKCDRESLSEKLKADGFDIEKGNLSERVLFVRGMGLLETEEYEKGMFTVQDESSVLAVETLNPQAGERIIDMCAAPGGKTLAMAEWMKNSGKIRAYDIYEHKLKLIAKESERLGISIIETGEQDGTVFCSALENWADRVLVDGPCTGLGVVRRKPEIKYRELDDNGRGLAVKQLEILNNAAGYVKKGGYLLYSTCTINKLENDFVTNEFISSHPEYELELSRQLMPGIDETDGFYISRFKKK